MNVDANNRQLHREEVDLIKKLSETYVQEKGISLEEAQTELTRGALYNIDAGWKENLDRKIDSSEIAKYNQAYQYLLNQTKNNSVDELNAAAHNWQKPDGTLASKARQPDSYAGHLTEAEQRKADQYIGEVGKGFTATTEDYNNKDLFLTNTLSGNTNKASEYYNDKKEFIQNSAAIKDNELDFGEKLKSNFGDDAQRAKGFATGVATTIKDTIVGTYEYMKHPIDNTKELINSTVEAAKNYEETAKKVGESIDQGAEKYNATIDLYKMQKDEGSEAEYKGNIAGQIAGGGGIGAAGKKRCRGCS